MERVDLWVKAVAGIVAGVFSILTGLFGVPFTILLGLMFFDLCTGIIAGCINGGFKSSVGRKGFMKKLSIILLIGASYMVEFAVLHSNGVVGSIISGAYCVIEFGSIVENVGRSGAPVPQVVSKYVAVLKNKVDNAAENVKDDN